jgi:hypothetical protein
VSLDEKKKERGFAGFPCFSVFFFGVVSLVFGRPQTNENENEKEKTTTTATERKQGRVRIEEEGKKKMNLIHSRVSTLARLNCVVLLSLCTFLPKSFFQGNTKTPSLLSNARRNYFLLTPSLSISLSKVHGQLSETDETVPPAKPLIVELTDIELKELLDTTNEGNIYAIKVPPSHSIVFLFFALKN